MIIEITKIGKRGTVVLPRSLRSRFKLKEEDLLRIEEIEDGILLRPVVAIPVEIYSLERQAELLLNNTVDAEDYKATCKEVLKLSLDPKDIPHQKLSGTEVFAEWDNPQDAEYDT